MHLENKLENFFLQIDVLEKDLLTFSRFLKKSDGLRIALHLEVWLSVRLLNYCRAVVGTSLDKSVATVMVVVMMVTDDYDDDDHKKTLVKTL